MSTLSPTTLGQQVQNISLIIIAVTLMLFMVITLMICALLHVNKARINARKIEQELLFDIFKRMLVKEAEKDLNNLSPYPKLNALYQKIKAEPPKFKSGMD